MCDEVTKSENVSASRKRGDAITASPRPWRVETNRFGQHYVVCESGSGDRVRDYIAGPIKNESDARLIVDAVNERDRLKEDIESWRRGYIKARTERNACLLGCERLRDIVQRMARVAQDALDLSSLLSDIVGDNPERAKTRSEIEALLREVRAEIEAKT